MIAILALFINVLIPSHLLLANWHIILRIVLSTPVVFASSVVSKVVPELGLLAREVLNWSVLEAIRMLGV